MSSGSQEEILKQGNLEAVSSGASCSRERHGLGRDTGAGQKIPCKSGAKVHSKIKILKHDLGTQLNQGGRRTFPTPCKGSGCVYRST